MWRYLKFLLLALALFAFSPAQGEMTLNLNTSLDTFSYDLDQLHLQLEKLEARWQLAPSADGNLLVERLHARRLTITLRGNTNAAKNSKLPEHIKLPFALKLQQAELDEIVIISAEKRYTLSKVQLSLEADSNTFKLNLHHADTPWGEAQAALNMANSKPFAIVGSVALQQSGTTPYAIKTRLSGNLQTLQITLHDSHWRGQSLSGNAKIGFDGTKIHDLNLLAQIASNQISASGTWAETENHLEWQANLPDLSAFSAQISGAATASGTLQGETEHPALQFKLSAQQLGLPGDFKIENLHGQGEIATGDDGKVQAELTANNLQYGKNLLSLGNVSLQGTRSNHQLQLQAQAKGLQLSGTLQGALTARYEWQGWLQSLALQGNTPITLQAPAALRLAANSAQLDAAVFKLAQGRVLLDTLQWENGNFRSQGRLEEIALTDLPDDFLHLPPRLKGDLQFAGTWDLTAKDTLNGNISLWRAAGDLTLSTADGKPQGLGLDEMRAAVQFTHNNAAIHVSLAGEQVGTLDAKLNTTLSKLASGYALLASAPLTLTASAQLNTLAWLPLPASLPDASVDGQISMSVTANGTLAAPNLRGNVSGKNLQLTLPTQGLALADGTLDASFAENRLLITQSIWHGGKGRLSASGALSFANKSPEIDLDWSAEQFTAISRSDRLLVLSGAGKTRLAQGLLTISGDFSVDQGLIELAGEDAPTLGDDVVVLGATETLQEPALKILLDKLHINLGKQFTLRGRGLNAELTGGLTLTGLTQYHPYTTGSIQVTKGTVAAYGQTLSIERGILNFNGALDNPGLNIRAMRGSKPTDAGVEVSGNALLPTIKLVSDPDVPETEKLAWLMLGHGMDKTGKNDLAMLSLAAGALLSQGQSVPMQTRLARMAGLDEFGVSGSDPQSTVLSFGKRISSQLFLSYEKSISGLLDIARLTYIISPRWSLRAAAGSESAVDVLYTFSFK